METDKAGIESMLEQAAQANGDESVRRRSRENQSLSAQGRPEVVVITGASAGVGRATRA